jgi:hypothetical protein
LFEPVLKVRLQGSNLSFTNVSAGHLIANGKTVVRNQSTDVITSKAEIIIEGLPCKIAF